MHYKTDFGVMESLRESLETARQQNEDLKNKLLAMRCGVLEIADDLEDLEDLEPRFQAIVTRLRKLAE